MARIRTNLGEVELTQRRGRNSKVFRRQDGKYRVVSRLHPVHWDDGAEWVEVDAAPISVDGGRTWSTASTPYHLLWDSENLILSYQSKKGGEVTVRLAALDGVPVGKQTGLPVVSGQSIKSRVAPDFDIELRVRAYGVEIFKILHGPAAPRRMEWEVIEGNLSNIRLDLLNTSGQDNLLNSQARRGSKLNRRRRVEISHTRSGDDILVNPGRTTYRAEETLTGDSRFIERATGARSWVPEIEWPVEIDVTISESVVANNDDGRGQAGNWYISQPRTYDADFNPGWRFQTVNVPQGQTLDSAIMTVNILSAAGSDTFTLAGNNVDNAADWTNLSANDPDTMAATTATVSVNTLAVGIRTINVLGPVQEIINRAGWTANNALRLGYSDVTGATGYQYFEDYSAAGTAEAELEIIYTAAGGDPEGRLVGGKLIRGGLLTGGVLVG